MKDADGKHSISLNARLQKKAQQLGVSRVWLSIASTKKRAAALVVLES
jgi:phosphopantetheinyl transferase (holo-ACP synthase)